MRKPWLVLWVLGLLAAPAAAQSVFLHVAPSERQTSRMEQGRRVIDDASERAVVRFIAPKPANKKRLAFALFVLNKTERGIDVGPEIVTSNLGDGTPVRILNYADLIKEEKRRDFWQNFGQALTSSSGNESSTATYNGFVNGTIGSTPYQSSSTATLTYSDSAARAVALAENRQRAADLALNQAISRQGIESMLQLTTVDPGQVLGGLVAFDIPKTARGKQPVLVVFKVSVAGEIHSFNGTFDPE